MRALATAALAVTLCVAGSPADAAPCAQGADVMEEAVCLGEAYEQADRALNDLWPRVLAEHPSGGIREEHTKQIRAAQRAWIAFRDADCEARSTLGIPKYWQVNRLSCLIEMTQERTRLLKETYVD